MLSIFGKKMYRTATFNIILLKCRQVKFRPGKLTSVFQFCLGNPNSVPVLPRLPTLMSNPAYILLFIILPYLNYCCEVWGITYKSTIDSLIILQKNAIRIISKVGRREHTNELFCKLKLFKFTDLIDL